MPQRDEVDYERRRDAIIAGALEVFSTKGFEKATNKDIAEAAGIHSPALIYHYFHDKADLFRQAVERHAPPLGLVAQADALMDRPPREVLTLFGRALLSMMDNRLMVAVMRAMLGESLRRPAVAEMFVDFAPRRAFDMLTRYLEHQIAAGTLRPMNARIAVRCFVGPLVVYFLNREVFPMPDSRTLDWETMVETSVDIFMCGMAVEAR
ncbi:MAG TPA: TetR/AcrR family transcriptional regulator [Ktedonobacterales bacterium]|nr:TetR/AcrR family transcriptional regulator [Ktedonobacterales bacterium]